MKSHFLRCFFSSPPSSSSSSSLDLKDIQYQVKLPSLQFPPSLSLHSLPLSLPPLLPPTATLSRHLPPHQTMGKSKQPRRSETRPFIDLFFVFVIYIFLAIEGESAPFGRVFEGLEGGGGGFC